MPETLAPLLQWIDLDRLVPHPGNVRSRLGDLTELTKSINGTGILEPLLVLPADDTGAHMVVAGHRRLAAACKSKAKAPAPCVVRDLTETEVIEAQLVENLQRRELTAIEEARAYARLIDLEVTVTEIARKVGRSQATVKSRLDLLALPPQVLTRVDNGDVSLSVAADLAARADDVDAMNWLAIEALTSTNPTQLTHAVARYVRDRNRTAALDAERAKLDKASIPEHDVAYWSTPHRILPGRPCEVTQLGLGRDGSKHRLEPCHAVYLDARPTDAAGEEFAVDRTTICRHPARHSTLGSDTDRSLLQSPPDVFAHLGHGGGDDLDASFEEARADARAARTARTLFAQGLIGHDELPEIPTVAARIIVTDWADLPNPNPDTVAEYLTDELDDIDELTAVPDAAGPTVWSRAAWAILAATIETDAAPRPYRQASHLVWETGSSVWWAWHDLLVEHGLEPGPWDQARRQAWDESQQAVDFDALELDPDTLEVLRTFATAHTSELLIPPSGQLDDLEARELATTAPAPSEGGLHRVTLTSAGERVAAALTDTPATTEVGS